MVTTTSAVLTASAALAALCAPLSTAPLTAASDRSKASTWCCALHRLAAIGPPILPRPMKAIFAILSSLRPSVEDEVVRHRFKMCLDHVPGHALDAGRLPPGLLVLVDQ